MNANPAAADEPAVLRLSEQRRRCEAGFGFGGSGALANFLAMRNFLEVFSGEVRRQETYLEPGRPGKVVPPSLQPANFRNSSAVSGRSELIDDRLITPTVSRHTAF